MSDWTTQGDIRKRIQREWDNGRILAAMLGSEAVFPLRIPLKKPDSKALAEHFEAARQWIAALSAVDKEQTGSGCRLEWQEVAHRQLGRNRIPVAAIVESEKEGLALIGKQSDADRFRELAATVAAAFPALAPWMRQYPLKVIEQAENWPRLLAVLDWVVCHPGANVYLRQIDVSGLDTKFIEQHRSLLSDLLDRVLPSDRIDERYSGAKNFEQRYGFKRKPLQVRFRFLDRNLSLHGLSDIAVTSEAFVQMVQPIKRVFVTENEINFLSFPDVADGLMLFGGGYGFEHLSQADWLRQKEIFYWGDIDTHGFAILDQLRSTFPSANSLMMDRATLLEHRIFWGNEDRPASRQLERLNAEESALYEDLRFDRIAPSLRLEQERIGFAWINAELARAGLK
ncbi:MAG: DUF3322 domain-containing protein [Gallionella sp.]|nr:DUF3322 domain-containing protein [Gallionella sp.]